MKYMEPETSGIKRKPDGTFAKGQSGHPEGRPVGSLSVIGRLKQIYEENPDKFEAFVLRYAENEANDRHQVEMIDGKPQQNTDITSKGEKINISLISFDEYSDSQ